MVLTKPIHISPCSLFSPLCVCVCLALFYRFQRTLDRVETLLRKTQGGVPGRLASIAGFTMEDDSSCVVPKGTFPGTGPDWLRMDPVIREKSLQAVNTWGCQEGGWIMSPTGSLAYTEEAAGWDDFSWWTPLKHLGRSLVSGGNQIQEMVDEGLRSVRSGIHTQYMSVGKGSVPTFVSLCPGKLASWC